MTKKAQVIAFYLPQFHPILENDTWWGKGFTEWTNVGKAQPLFRGHYQPRVPADLGYYDLRMPEVREAQAELAREAGVAAFCYWHYWFGNGKQLLEKPLQEVVRLGKPDFPFCLAWANHSWERKDWNANANHLVKQTLIKQEYGDQAEVDQHFYTMLPMFQDPRYYRIKGKLVFVFHLIKDIPYLDNFITRWQELAEINGLPGFHFIARGIAKSDLEHEYFKRCDATTLALGFDAFGKTRLERKLKTITSIMIRRPLNVVEYREAIKYYEDDIMRQANVYPTLLPNWDHSPRSGLSGTIFNNSTPEYFYQHVKSILDLIKDKDADNKIIFLKSWNEWAEGNYMEPDLRFGKGYITALKVALTEGL